MFRQMLLWPLALGLAAPACAGAAEAAEPQITPAAASASTSDSEKVWIPDQPMRCNGISGWQHYQINGPVPVRDRPAASGKILGSLPAIATDQDYSVLFDILTIQRGWVQIANASDAYNEAAGYPKRSVYQGVGWIPADAALLRVQSGRGYARPDLSSTRLLDLKPRWLGDAGVIKSLAGCHGEWVLLAYRLTRSETGQSIPKDQQKTEMAWFRGYCPIEETTCDMASVDEDEAA